MKTNVWDWTNSERLQQEEPEESSSCHKPETMSNMTLRIELECGVIMEEGSGVTVDAQICNSTATMLLEVVNCNCSGPIRMESPDGLCRSLPVENVKAAWPRSDSKDEICTSSRQ